MSLFGAVVKEFVNRLGRLKGDQLDEAIILIGRVCKNPRSYGKGRRRKATARRLSQLLCPELYR